MPLQDLQRGGGAAAEEEEEEGGAEEWLQSSPAVINPTRPD